jgi:nitrite reductase/ring-hydroxylating ferredoxin subunit
MKFHRVAAMAELSEGQAAAYEIEGRPILLVRRDETVYALDNYCPHAGARMERGRVGRETITCPWHGVDFDLATGRCRASVLGPMPWVVTHTVRISEGEVEVALSLLPFGSRS